MMFKEDYKKAMSFPVSEALLKKTARQMRQAASETPRYAGRKSFLPRLAAAGVALCLLTVELIGFGSLSGSLSGGSAAGGAGGAPKMTADVSEANDAGIQLYAAQNEETAPAEGGAEIEERSIAGDEDGFKTERFQTASYAGIETAASLLWGETGAADAPVWEIKTALPVYEDPLAAGNFLDENAVSQTAGSLAQALGKPEDELRLALREESGLCLYEQGDLSLFNTGKAVLRFPEDGAYAAQSAQPAEQVKDAAEYFYEQYRVLVPLEKPAFSLRLDRTGAPTGQVIVYEAAGDEREQFLSYAVTPVELTLSRMEKGEYRLDSLAFQAVPPVQAGECAVLSEEEATRRFRSGQYQTDGQEEGLEICPLSSVELLYQRVESLGIVPCYRFLVETESRPSGFAVCCVPAVSSETAFAGE